MLLPKLLLFTIAIFTKVKVMTDRLTMLFVLQLHSWQPGIKNPYRGMVVWPVPENIDISVTLFKVPTHQETLFTPNIQTGAVYYTLTQTGAVRGKMETDNTSDADASIERTRGPN